MSRNLPFVSIIVPAKNEARFIGCCLKSLKRQSYPKDRIEILVIDNGSIDNTSEIALSYDVSVYKSDATRIGAVRNFGVEKAKGSFLAFIDADCIADPKWLETVVPYLIENKGIGALGGDALSRPDGTWLERYWFYRNSRTTRSLSSLNGSSICLSKAVLKKVGGFHEKINAGEDTKLSDDIKGLGLKIEWCPSADMIHLGNKIALYLISLRQNFFFSFVAYFEVFTRATFYFLMSSKYFIIDCKPKTETRYIIICCIK